MPGNPPAVVHMGMGDQKVIDLGRGDREGELGVGVPALEEAAVHQQTGIPAFQQETAAGNRSCRPQECEFHGMTSFAVG